MECTMLDHWIIHFVFLVINILFYFLDLLDLCPFLSCKFWSNIYYLVLFDKLCSIVFFSVANIISSVAYYFHTKLRSREVSIELTCSPFPIHTFVTDSWNKQPSWPFWDTPIFVPCMSMSYISSTHYFMLTIVVIFCICWKSMCRGFHFTEMIFSYIDDFYDQIHYIDSMWHRHL